MTCRWLGCLATLALGACTSTVSEQAGLNVELEMTHGVDDVLSGVQFREGEPRGFENELGLGFVVDQAQLVLSAVELVPCVDGEEGTVSALLKWLDPVPVAHAHGATSPWAYAVPQVIDLMAEDQLVRPVGVIEPPPGRYCALRLYSAPADADALGIAAFPGLEGLSMRVVGQAITPDAGARRMNLESGFEQQVEVPIHAGVLTLSKGASSARIRLRLSYAKMFEGVDIFAQDPAFQAFAVQENLLKGFSVEECESQACER